MLLPYVHPSLLYNHVEESAVVIWWNMSDESRVPAVKLGPVWLSWSFWSCFEKLPITFASEKSIITLDDAFNFLDSKSYKKLKFELLSFTYKLSFFEFLAFRKVREQFDFYLSFWLFTLRSYQEDQTNTPLVSCIGWAAVSSRTCLNPKV